MAENEGAVMRGDGLWLAIDLAIGAYCLIAGAYLIGGMAVAAYQVFAP